MGFFDKIKVGLSKTRDTLANTLGSVFTGFSEIDDDFYDELEECLILADLGMDTAVKATDQLRKKVRQEHLKTTEEAKTALKEILVEMLQVGDTALNLSTSPAVVLVVGVNGVGKTTTIGKIATQLVSEGKNVLLVAGDTFRAAAADQLEIWAQRSGASIVRQNEGADPASVVFDGIQSAKAKGADVILIDTAGRLHNKQNLMNELQPDRRSGAAGCSKRSAFGAGRHNRSERTDPGKRIFQDRRCHSCCTDKAGRNSKGRYRDRRGRHPANPCEICRCGGKGRRSNAL